jgi:hypothetical protein
MVGRFLPDDHFCLILDRFCLFNVHFCLFNDYPLPPLFRPRHKEQQKMTDKPQLSPKQQLALQNLLAGRTKSQTAAAVGVTPRTLSRWLAHPAFHAALTDTTDQALANAAHRLADTLDDAVAILAEVIANKDARDLDRLRAADLVIHRGLDLIQQKQLVERIAALEAKTYVSQEP